MSEDPHGAAAIGCCICEDEIEPSTMFPLARHHACAFFYCTSCVTAFFEHQAAQNVPKPFICDCMVSMTLRQAKDLSGQPMLTDSLRSQYFERIAVDALYCADAGCNRFIEDVAGLSMPMYSPPCPQCALPTCYRCRKVWSSSQDHSICQAPEDTPPNSVYDGEDG